MTLTRIGITGGIGSGKSYVAALVSDLCGMALYDSDTKARELMLGDAIIRARLTELIGTDAYLPDGSLNRQCVAEYLFHSAENAQRINAIVHPAVRCDWLRFAAEAKVPVILESAILIEAELADTVDSVIVVTAPEDLRIRRAMARDGATESQIKARMARQMPQEELITHADHVIINDGRPLRPQLQQIGVLSLHMHNKQQTE